MDRRGQTHRRPFLDISTVFIACSFVGIWCLGPTRGRSEGPTRRLRYARVAYVDSAPSRDRPVLDPKIILEASGSSIFRIAAPPPPETDVEASVRTREARTLAADEVDLALSPPAAEKMWPDQKKMVYAPSWKRDMVFPEVAKRTAVVRVEVLGSGLKGFQLPEVPDALVRNGGELWAVLASVEVGPSGDVEHVFLETTSDNVDMDGRVVRWLYRATMSDVTGRRRGRVRISYGHR